MFKILKIFKIFNNKFKKSNVDNEYLDIISDFNNTDIISILLSYIDLYNNNEYLYSKKYSKKFKIHHLGAYHIIFNKINNDPVFYGIGPGFQVVNPTQKIVQNIHDHLKNNHTRNYAIYVYENIIWVSTDNFNTDLGDDKLSGTNISIPLNEIKSGDWIPYKNYERVMKMEKRNKLINQILKNK